MEKENVIKLTDENFYHWKFEVKMGLQLKNLWKNVEFNSIEEYFLSFVDAKQEADAAEMLADITTKERREWIVDGQKAIAYIGTRISSKFFNKVRDAKTAHGAWTEICREFEGLNKASKLTLKCKFYEAKMDPEESLSKFLDRILLIVDKLTDIGVATPEWEVCCKILSALPEAYIPVKMSCLMMPEDQLTTSFLKNQFALEEPSEKKADPDEALNTDVKKENRTCFKCGTRGHIATNCTAPKSKVDAYQLKRKKEKEATAGNAISFNTEIDDTTPQPAGSTPSDRWYLDSGCTRHMANSKKDASNIRPSDVNILTALTEQGKSKSIGDIAVKNGPVIKEALIVPTCRRNLMSVRKMCAGGRAVLFREDSCEVIVGPIQRNTDQVIATGSIDESGLYALNQISTTSNAAEANAAESDNLLELWHQRLGHVSKDTIVKMAEQEMVLGLKIAAIKEGEVKCQTCDQGKQARSNFNSVDEIKTTQRGEVIHSDLQGPFAETSWGGARYCLSFVDDFTRKSWVYPIAKKSQAFSCFKEFEALLETQFGVKIKCFKTDHGGEYTSNEFAEHLKSRGILPKNQPPRTPERRGVAERFNRTLLDKVRPMLIDARLSRRFWAEAANTANFLKNRCPTKLLGSITPEEAWIGKKPTVVAIRRFGCRVQFKDNGKVGKLDNRSKEGVLMGFDQLQSCYRIWSLEKKKIVYSRDVSFYENEINKGPINENSTTPPANFQLLIDENEEEPEDLVPEEVLEYPSPKSEAPSDPIQPAVFPTATPNVKPLRRSARLANQADSFDDEFDELIRSKIDESAEQTVAESMVVTDIMGYRTPQTLKEALESEDCEKWKVAIKTELDSLSQMETWTVVEDAGKPIVAAKWLFKVKVKPSGEIEKYKARYVAKGFTQTKGIDYQETFAPVVRLETLRFMLNVAITEELDILHLDVVTAFLYGELHEEVYIAVPEAYQSPQLLKMKKPVCRLNKAIYGLKQAGRCWNEKIKKFLLENGFQQSKSDQCLFYKGDKDSTCYIPVYVDDCLLIGNQEAIAEMKKIFCSTFKMNDLGQLSALLGINITRTENEITLDQSYYITRIIQKFGMSDCKAVATPMEGSLPPNPSAPKFEDVNLFQQAIGSLIYLSKATRPDIAYAVSTVAQSMKNPTEEDWVKVKRIFRYLQGTTNLKLKYKKGRGGMIGYADASFAEDKFDRKSISGYAFLANGGAVSWRSRKQPIVAISSTEAELIALCSAVQEAIWFKKMSTEIGLLQNPITVREDNQSTLKLARENVFSERSKHIDTRYHFITERIANGDVKNEYVPTNENTADIFTKPLGRVLFEKHRKGLGLEF